MTDMPALLEARGLRKHLGGRPIVNGVDLVCDAGAVIPIVFVTACAFSALGLCFTALVPTIDHMNLPIFLVVLPVGFISATYFPLDHPVLAALSTVNPLYHLAEGLRGLLLGAAAGAHLAGLAVLVAVMLVVLVPLDMRLLRKRVLGD
jgi:lipooligosaccharide transport system permease protein